MIDILLTNDDGYSSIGFYPLLRELRRRYTVCGIAPDTQRSWVGKSLTAHADIEFEKVAVEGLPVFAVNGTPADCVQVGLFHVLDQKPMMAVSGINIGENVGRSLILSSGTVGAAMEAAIDGIRSVAFSLYIPPEYEEEIDFFDAENFHIFQRAAMIACKIVDILMRPGVISSFDLISVNIPFEAGTDTEYEITVPFKNAYGQVFHRSGTAYRMRSPLVSFENAAAGTDIHALAQGKVSVSPISLDLVVPQSTMRILDEQLREHW
ncbi:5'/3'-nucleotidase SurE [Nocardia sp. NPDC088792]|uniref:5'/3'-nucleotidase SurE n=1 Tax=Nocardia sp. NPDC088792 TaxID=3364332 RepID=UPI0038229252